MRPQHLTFDTDAPIYIVHDINMRGAARMPPRQERILI